MLKLNAPAGIHWRRSNMNKRDPILMQYVRVLKDCQSLNAADEMNCPMPRSVEKVPVRNEKRCIARYPLQHSYKNRRTSNLIMRNNQHRETELKCTNVIYEFTCPSEDCKPRNPQSILYWSHYKHIFKETHFSQTKRGNLKTHETRAQKKHNSG